MSGTPKEQTRPSSCTANVALERDTPECDGRTFQMNPAILGQAANVNSASGLFDKLDTASEMLAQAAREEEGQGLNGESESIQEYMTALLERLNGPATDMDGTQTVVLPVVEPVAKSVSAPIVASAAEPAVEHDSSVSDAALAPETTLRNVSQVESRGTISEMRELANLSTRSSFNTSRGRQVVYEMHNKLVVTLVALVVSFALISLTSNVNSPTFFAAIVALIVALSWTSQYFRLGVKLRDLCLSSNDDETITVTDSAAVHAAGV